MMSFKGQNSNIEWTIDELQPGESATLRYKLKLTDMNDESLIDKVISTNRNVMITYEDDENNSKSAEVTTSPSVSLKRIPAESPTPSSSQTPNPDNTTSNEPLPKTGFTKVVGAFIISFATISLTIYLRSKKFKDIQ